MSNQDSINTRRIAKNTILLYFRMFVVLLVGLYTSRVVLDSLGIENFGLYNVVGGIVVLLSFLNGAMAASTQRFLNFELGKKNGDGLRNVFSSSLIIHFGVALIVVVMAETVGLYFLNTYMNVSAERLYAANWVYQFSIVALALNITTIPYNASIIAHERMSAFAYISIIEVFLKLGVAVLIRFAPFDRLIFYAFLMFVYGLIIRYLYVAFCKKNFDECNAIKIVKDKYLLKKMVSFSSWTIVGNVAFIFHTQGIAIILNIFFGAAVNAAQGISNQVNGVVSGFVQNFLTAMKPQVVKNFACGNLRDMHNLIIMGSKFSFFLVLLFVVPLYAETPYILNVWLKEVPQYTVVFIRLLLLITLFDSFNSLLNAAKGATGNIKKYMIVQSSISFLHLPVSYVLFSCGYAPYYAMVVYLLLVMVMQTTRIVFVCNSINLSILKFFKGVIFNCMLVFALSFFIMYVIKNHCVFFHNKPLFVLFVSFCATICSICLVGLNKQDRSKIMKMVKRK